MTDRSSSTYVVAAEEHFTRLDEFIQRREVFLPLAAVRRAIEQNRVLVNGWRRDAGWRVRTGNTITADLDESRSMALEPDDTPLDVLFEDEFFIVVNKPPGMLSHPSMRERTGTLLNALLGYYGAGRGVRPKMWPALVHRLDRDTSGILVVATQEKALQKLSTAFQQRETKKTYQAIVWGAPMPSHGVINAPIGRHPVLWPRWRVMDDGKEAVTEYRVARNAGPVNLVELEPKTGRTHQLRVHLAHLGHPIVGDSVYGVAAAKSYREAWPAVSARRQMLHAVALEFVHPITRARIELVAPLPQDMLDVLAAYGRPGDSDVD